LKDTALKNIPPIFVTDEVSNVSSGWLKVTALLNIKYIFVTDEVSHPSSG